MVRSRAFSTAGARTPAHGEAIKMSSLTVLAKSVFNLSNVLLAYLAQVPAAVPDQFGAAHGNTAAGSFPTG
jgi:hypothetical protein